MKQSNFIYIGIGIITVCFFWLTSSGRAQTEGHHPSSQFLAQVLQKTNPAGLPQNQDNTSKEFGDIRINWKHLGLSEDQKKQMEQKRREFQINTAGIREQLRFAERDLRLEMAKDTADRAKIESFINTITTLKRQVSEAAVQNLLAIKGILTPEQLEKLEGFRPELPKELQKLPLTAEQRSKIQGVLKNSMQTNRETLSKLRELKAKLQEMLLSSQKIVPEQLKQLETEIAANELTLEKARVELLLQIKDVLTPEQRAELQKTHLKPQEKQPKVPAPRKGQ